MRSLWPRLQRRPEIVLITDPGPDPDDAKTLLILATLHRRGVLGLRAVVCNGGGEPAARARLALCLLRHLGVDDVPVGVGSAGVPSRPEPHEYMLQGYDDVEPADLAEGSALLRATLGAARARQLTVVCISGLRDFADVFLKAPELLASVGEVAIQGGLERADGTPWGWAPDTSVNNSARRSRALCGRRRSRAPAGPPSRRARIVRRDQRLPLLCPPRARPPRASLRRSRGGNRV